MLTKVDGDARGGAALSINAVTGVPVKFLGTGERTDALEVFHPDRLAGRILGMGDVLTLIERAGENVDQKQAEEMALKLQRNTFTLEDMLGQMQQLKRMGPVGQLMELIPGMGGAAKEAQQAVERGDLQARRGDHPVDDSWPSAAIRTSSPPSRRRRIARGSGTTLQDVNRLIKQFAEMRKLMKQFGGGGKRQMLPFGPRR